MSRHSLSDADTKDPEPCGTPISALIAAIEALAPPRAAAEWDNSGLQVLGGKECARYVAVALDPTPDTISRALAMHADFLFCHHPLSFKPQSLAVATPYYESARLLLRAGTSLYSAHTSLDANPSGPAFWLANELGLQDRRVLEPTWTRIAARYCLLEQDPALNASVLETAAHVSGVLHAERQDRRVVVTAHEDVWPEVLARFARALGQEPLFVKAASAGHAHVYGFGCVGALPQALEGTELLERLAALLPPGNWTRCGKLPALVRRVAFCPGSGASLAERAFSAGADVYITGDVKYHAAREARGCIVDVGHFSLEEEMMRRAASCLARQFSGSEVRFLASEDPFQPLLPEREGDRKP